MVRPCCVCGMKKNSDAKTKGIRFFVFPNKKNALHSAWIKSIREMSTKKTFKPKKNSIICAQHFNKDCFTSKENRLWLKKNSNPTIFNLSPAAEKENEQLTIQKSMGDEATSEAKGDKTRDSTPSGIDDDTSSSLSPPLLQPFAKECSDFEETIEDPPDLGMYQVHQDFDDDDGMTSLADLDMIKMDHIGSVADVLGPDPYSTEDFTADQSDSLGGEEMVEVDGQTIVSFTSAEEMQEYIARREARGKLTKTKDFKQIKGWRNKFQLNQLTPSLSPVSCPSPTQQTAAASQLTEQNVNMADASSSKANSVSCGASSAGIEDDEEDEEVTMFEVIDPDAPVTSSPDGEENGPAISPTQPIPEMDADGLMSQEYAEWAATAVGVSSSLEARQTKEKLKSNNTSQHRDSQGTTHSTPKQSTSETNVSKSTEKRLSGSKPISRRESEEIPNFEMSVSDDSPDNLVVQEDFYEEDYDVPMAAELPAAKCGQRFCRLGCICDSLSSTTNKPKLSVEHCSLPECMLVCVCGYQPGKPSSRKCFASLLKGNESFYSKIEWTRGRRRREIRVPERFSEFHLGNDTPTNILHNGRLSLNPESKSKVSARGVSSHRSRSSSPFKNGFPPNRSDAQQRGSCDKKTSPLASRLAEPFRVKVCTDQIKLLRWNSFVSLTKVYVAPDQDIFCMEHSVYNCPCIESNKRILRIASKYAPNPNDSPGKKNSPTKDAVKIVAKESTNPPVKNVAKKHTHPSMRFANSGQPKEIKPKERMSLSPTPDSLPKISSMSKMRKLLQDERFELKKLMTDEKTRAFDEDIDLSVRQGQTVQLVAWIRFHRIYHAGRMHIRFLSRRAGPVILVMRPTEIVAADITCDIQSMTSDPDAPEIVKELLDPCISPEETSRYAVLLCDGVKWELVGCLTLKVPDSPPPVRASSPPPKVRTVEIVQAPPPVIRQVLIEEPDVSDVTLTPLVDKSSLTDKLQQVSKETQQVTPCPLPTSQPFDPEAEERQKAMKERQRQLEERLNELKSKLSVSKFPSMLRGQKNRYRPAPSSRPAKTTDQQPVEISLVSDTQQDAVPPVRRAGKRPPDTSFLIPDQCILPDDVPEITVVSKKQKIQPSPFPTQLFGSLILPDVIVDKVVKEPTRSMYPAVEKLAMLTRLVQSGGDVNYASNVRFPFLKESMFDSCYDRTTDYSLPTPRYVPKPKSKPKPAPVPSLPTPRAIAPAPPPPPPPVPVAVPSQSKPPEVKLLKLQPLGSSIPTNVAKQGPIQRIRILPSQSLEGVKSSNIFPTLTGRNGIEPSVIQKQRIHWSNKGVRPPVPQKPTGMTSTLSTVVSTTLAPTETLILPEASAPRAERPKIGNTIASGSQSILCKVLKPTATNTTTVTLNPNYSSSSSKNPLNSAALNNSSAATPVEKTLVSTAKTNVVVSGSDATHTTPANIFPKILIAQVSSVQSANGIVQSLKIILDAVVDGNRDSCPTRASMLLPLHNKEDRWCLVAIDHVPQTGLRVPGIAGYIPAKILERAASAAVERKARVSFPLHIHANTVGSVFKMNFGVYGTPQLTRHVFLGPFPSSYLEKCSPFQPCMILIKLTKPLTSETPSPAESVVDSLKSASVTQEAVPTAKASPTPEASPSLEASPTPEASSEQKTTTEVESRSTSPASVEVEKPAADEPKEAAADPATETNEPTESVEEKQDNLPEQSCADDVQSSNQSSSSDTDASSRVTTPSEQSEESVSKESPTLNSKVQEIEKSDQKATKSDCTTGTEKEKISQAEELNGTASLRALAKLTSELVTPKQKKPMKILSARLPGLPPTTVSVMSSSMFIVKHPTCPEVTKLCRSLDEAKIWLKSLIARPDSSQSTSRKSTSSFSQEESKSSSSHEESNSTSETSTEETESRSASVSSISLPQKTRPQKKIFTAHTEGIPSTTIAVVSDQLVLVKHPLTPDLTVDFSSIADAKQWLVNLAIETKMKKRNDSSSNEESVASSESNEEDMVDVDGQSQEESQDRNDLESSPSRKPKRVRRLTEKARILAASKSKKNRNNSNRSKRPSFHVTSVLGKRSTTQQQLHIRKEQERRGLLCRLLRELDALLAPDSGTRAKVVVLKNATSTIKLLEATSKDMEDQYQLLKVRRAALLTKREKMFSELPVDVRQIFNCLMDSVALPTRHMTLAETFKRSRFSKQSPAELS